MLLNLKNEQVAELRDIAIANYAGDRHGEAISESVRSVIAVFEADDFNGDAANVSDLIFLADRHYQHNMQALKMTHEEALAGAAVIVAMACNMQKITNWLQPYRPRR